MVSVLQVYRTYFPDPPGGLQEAIRQIALATTKQGMQNTIFTLSPSAELKNITFPEARVVRCRSWAAPASCDLGGLDAFRTYSSLAKDSDVVHHYFPWPFADLLRTVAGKSPPAVMTYISDIVRQRLLGRAYAPLMWKTLNNMKYIVANCEQYMQNSPILSSPPLRKKTHVIPLGIDETSYPSISDELIFQKLGLEAEQPYFLFIGALRYYKGLHFLIEAASKVEAKIVIAGLGPEGRKIRELSSQQNNTNIIFAGGISDAEKVALIKQCRALVLPSHLRAEAFGMVLVEASMYSRPMISCEIGTGTSFINKHQETGLVVPPASPSKLAAAMNALLADTTGAKQMGQNARLRYERLFSGAALGKAYSELFSEAARLG